MDASEVEAEPASTPFSLFQGDLLNRAFAVIGLQGRSVLIVVLRCVALVELTWLPMAVLAAAQGLFSTQIDARNFFADYAAYAQFLIAMPLFVVAEHVVSVRTREAARDFLTTGVVAAGDQAQVQLIHQEIRRWRLAMRPEAVLIAIAFLLSFFTIGPEVIGAGPANTWHTGAGAKGIPTLPGGLTFAGAWLMFIALPALNYTWLRLVWKVVIWTRYLYRMSRLRLRLVASHPDLTGGIGFISEVQAKWAIVIFAYGISNVAAVIAYKVGIEGASLWLMPVWAPAVLFVVIAPTLFTLPLLMFTRQLYRAKRRAQAAYREHARRHAVDVESRWLGYPPMRPADLGDVADLNNFAAVFTRMQQMRVVPFDLRSFGQLVASTVGSIATALPIVRLEGTLEDWLSLIAQMLGR